MYWNMAAVFAESGSRPSSMPSSPSSLSPSLIFITHSMDVSKLSMRPSSSFPRTHLNSCSARLSCSRGDASENTLSTASR